MTEIKIKQNGIEISISNEDYNECTWKEIMVLTMDAIKGMGYISDELNNMQEEWSEY